MANDFSGDSNCVALYRMESGALETDSKGTNTLTNLNSVGEDTTNQKEGSCCADFEASSTESLYIPDANLSLDFPFKNGSSNLNISICLYFRAESSVSLAHLVSKYYSSATYNSFTLALSDASKVYVIGGYNAGASQESGTQSNSTTDGTWYHVGSTINGTTGDYKVRIRNAATGELFQEVTGTFVYAPLSAEKAAFQISGYAGASAYSRFDGLMDEVVIFNDILTSDEIDQIYNGTYGASTQSPVPIFMQQMNHFNGGSLNGPTY